VAFFNYTTNQVTVKVVYYGPGLCGKTTNLQFIHHKTDPGSRGEMVSLETEGDRTLFFDLLPLEVGVIGGMRVRMQLYTVPGQVFYNSTRKLVLKSVDGLVFVADSQVAALDANMESMNNLLQNLGEMKQALQELPIILQFNKRDLKHIHSVETLNDSLNLGSHEVFEAAALHGVGVFETLRAISKKTLASVRRKIDGGRPKPAPRVTRPAVLVPQSAASALTPGSAPRELRALAGTRVQDAAAAVSRQIEDIIVGEAAPLVSRAPSLGQRAMPPSSEKVAESPSPTSERRAEVRTDEVKVEFAARSSDTGVVRVESRERARRIAMLSATGIEQELERLRRMARGEALASETGSAVSVLSCRATVKVPRSVLEQADRLTLDLRMAGAPDGETAIADVAQVELPRERSKARLVVELAIDLEGEESPT
jgi:hypothetical protein